jgi:enoyl-CoA hydratase/carnithine racemase
MRGQLEAAAAISGEARNTDDAREGLQAFLEKRRPRWSQP